ncbi:transposable element Tc1 transposase [Trichonephila clavipes]|nr:transposable element Tc1 transposase [Trichonephila clavipes]
MRMQIRIFPVLFHVTPFVHKYRVGNSALVLVACKMPQNSELSDYLEKGIIVGYHRKDRFLRNISSELNIAKSILTFVIKKWKMSGDCRNVFQHCRTAKLKKFDKNHQEYQQASVTVFVINAICKEAHLLVYQFRAATHKPLVTKSNRAARLRWSKTLRNWTLDE